MKKAKLFFPIPDDSQMCGKKVVKTSRYLTVTAPEKKHEGRARKKTMKKE